MSFLSQFNYQLYGPENGRKWVFVHGLMGFGANWRKIISGLEQTERCLSFDQRGHGKSFHASSYTPEDYADDIFKITEELGWDQFVLVGHSMGGRNVMNFAARYPQKVSHLVIEDIGPEGNPHAHEYYEYLLGLVPTPFVNRTQAKEFFNNEFVKVAKTRENVQVLAQYFYANIIDKPDGTADWRFSRQGIIDSVKYGRDKDRWEELASIQTPTLLVRGQNSAELKAEVYEKMMKSNPLIRGVEIPNAGHWVHSDQPQAFLEAIRTFVG